jgi:hypothetical protein
MANNIIPSTSNDLALELIDLQAIKERRTVDASKLIDCIRFDVSNHKAIVLPVIMKYIPRNAKLTSGDLAYIRSILKQGILETIDADPKVALSYVKATELIHAELLTRVPH